MNQVNYFQNPEWAMNISPEIQKTCVSILSTSSVEEPIYQCCQILSQGNSENLYNYLTNQALSSIKILGESCLSVAKKLLDWELVELAYDNHNINLFKEFVTDTGILEPGNCAAFILDCAHEKDEPFSEVLFKECKTPRSFEMSLGAAIMSGNLKYIRAYYNSNLTPEMSSRIFNTKITGYQEYEEKTEFSSAFLAILFDHPEILRELISLGLDTREFISYKRTTLYNKYYFNYLHEGWFKPKKEDSSLFHDFGNEQDKQSVNFLDQVYLTPKATIKFQFSINKYSSSYSRAPETSLVFDPSKIEQATPLLIAVQLNKQRIVEELLKEESLNDQLELALYQACYLGHFQIAKTLIDNGASLDSIKNYAEIEKLTQYLSSPKKYELELALEAKSKLEIPNMDWQKTIKEMQKRYLPQG